MSISAAYLRSVHGQLSLFAAVFIGAVVLAATALCLRSIFFERFAYEAHAPLPERLGGVAEQLRAGVAPVERLREFSLDDLNLLYGAWIDETLPDAGGAVARSLVAVYGASRAARVRRTLVTGNLRQRARALALLGLLSTEDSKPDAVRLCAYARERARRRGEQELVRQAETVWASLQGTGSDPRIEPQSEGGKDNGR